jgi:hypothetical protein
MWVRGPMVLCGCRGSSRGTQAACRSDSHFGLELVAVCFQRLGTLGELVVILRHPGQLLSERLGGLQRCFQVLLQPLNLQVCGIGSQLGRASSIGPDHCSGSAGAQRSLLKTPVSGDQGTDLAARRAAAMPLFPCCHVP